MLDNRLDQMTQRLALISVNEQQFQCVHVVHPDWSTISLFESRALDSFPRSVIPSFRRSVSPVRPFPHFSRVSSRLSRIL